MAVVPGDIAKTWVSTNAVGEISEYVRSLPFRPLTIINCAGLTDPKLPKQILNNANFVLPKNLLKFSQETEIDLVTFGSIMENNPELCDGNSYLMSKKCTLSIFDNQQMASLDRRTYNFIPCTGERKFIPTCFLDRC